MRYVTALAVGLWCWGCAGTPVAQEVFEPSPNIGAQPSWGPTGYDYVEYYYLPEIEVYYHVPTHEYFYFEMGYWRRGSSLPLRYRDYDLYHSYKVVINAHQPWRVHDFYKDGYSGFRGRHDQVSLRDSKDAKPLVIKDHSRDKKLVQVRKLHHGQRKAEDKGKHRTRKGVDRNDLASH